MDRRRVWWGAAVGGAVLAVLAVVLWPTAQEPERLPVRAREYTDTRICLLVDREGVTGAAAAPVWAGMQAASARTHAQISSLKVTGDGSQGRAEIVANTLVQQKCSTVLGAGDVESAALRTIAPANPAVRFAIVGQGGSSGNLVVLDSATDVQEQVDELLAG
ncbi:type 1 periplasmic-binding domain-containing protein [Kitasatospora fiedleri]|uniref:hypothetical protein n=1 Tax=Kitasatospora fiedleri TaxID=2991545 RepID=UPI00249B3CF1|nr:hypothetical protein [Kitasatospora fiedleri]